MKVFHEDFLYLHFRFEILYTKEYWRICADKMLVKLTTERQFLFHSFSNKISKQTHSHTRRLIENFQWFYPPLQIVNFSKQVCYSVPLFACRMHKWIFRKQEQFILHISGLDFAVFLQIDELTAEYYKNPILSAP